MPSAALWDKACKYLKEALHADVYSRWIAVIDPVDLEGSNLTLAVDNDFYQSWLEENYLPLILKALQSVSATDWQISFTVKARAASSTEPTPAKKERKTIRERLSPKSPKFTPSLNPKFTMDTFIVGPSNSFGHAAALAVAEAPGRAYNPLFIYGGVGLGKTHLMQAIGQSVLDSGKARNVRYLSSETMLNEYIDALQNRSLTQFRKRYRTADVLLIDDIHFLAGKDRIQEEFFHTFNTLFDSHKQIIMTSDRPASEITGLEKRLVSRFEWGLVTELEEPDFETRMAILRYKQKQMDVELPKELMTFIAENIRSNVRRLEGALIRAVSYASLTNQVLTLDSLQRLLRDTLEQEKAGDLSFADIQRTVAEHYDIRFADMSSSRRPRSIAVPRQVAMYLCRRMTPSSLPDIATAFGKTHATVLHAYRSIESRMDVDGDLKRNVVDISRKLGKTLA
ncbi:MAG: chromosomal replication initiator protein DnaA [Verrucomicrobia bacterium]|nr:chromosomal replication initiator protein DnaA [Verrucomicrobiota bacterium]